MPGQAVPELLQFPPGIIVSLLACIKEILLQCANAGYAHVKNGHRFPVENEHWRCTLLFIGC